MIIGTVGMAGRRAAFSLGAGHPSHTHFRQREYAEVALAEPNWFAPRALALQTASSLDSRASVSRLPSVQSRA